MKRIISLLLTVAMVLTMMPGVAFADSTPEKYVAEVLDANNQPVGGENGKYESLKEACAKVERGYTVNLLKDITVTETAEINCTTTNIFCVSFHGNEHTITIAANDIIALRFGSTREAYGVTVDNLTIKTAEGIVAEHGIYFNGGQITPMTNINVFGSFSGYAVAFYGCGGAILDNCHFSNDYPNGTSNEFGCAVWSSVAYQYPITLKNGSTISALGINRYKSNNPLYPKIFVEDDASSIGALYTYEDCVYSKTVLQSIDKSAYDNIQNIYTISGDSAIKINDIPTASRYMNYKAHQEYGATPEDYPGPDIDMTATVLYTSLANAIELEQDSGIVSLDADVSEELTISKPMTIVKNGFTANLKVGDGFELFEDSTQYMITVDNAVARIGTKAFSALEDALDAAVDGDTIIVLKNIAYDINGSGLFNIAKSITLDGDGHSISGYGSRSGNKTSVAINNEGSSIVNVTLKNLTINNAGSAGRPIETRGKIGTLTLDNITISATGGGNTQGLTIGGNQSEATIIEIKSSTIDVGAGGYPIIIFNPVELNIANSNLTGYCGVYFKDPNYSFGSFGSILNAYNSVFNASNIFDAPTTEGDENFNDFGVFVMCTDDIRINLNNCQVDASCKGTARQTVFSEDSWIEEETNINKYTVTGSNTKINGDIFDEEYDDNYSSRIWNLQAGYYTEDVSNYVADGFVCIANTDLEFANGYTYKVVPVEVIVEPAVADASGNITVGGEKIEVEGVEAAQDAATKITETLDNPEVTTFRETKIEEATRVTEKTIVRNVDNTSFNLSMILNEVKKEAKKQFSDTTVTNNDEITVKKESKSIEETFTDKDITKQITVDLTAAAVMQTVADTTTTTVTSMTFDVKPIATIIVKNGTSEPVTVTAVIPNDAITKPITFRLPVDSDVNEKWAAVYHKDNFMGNYEIKTGTDGKYIELSSMEFSEFKYVLVNADSAGAKIGDVPYQTLAEAVAAVQNGQQIVLQQDAEEETITVDREVTFTVDNNDKTNKATIKAAEGYRRLETSGNKYTFKKLYKVNAKVLLGFPGTAKATIGDKEVTEAVAGEKITFTVTPKDGYVFSYWAVSGKILSYDNYLENPVTITMPADDLTLTAVFRSEHAPDPTIDKDSLIKAAIGGAVVGAAVVGTTAIVGGIVKDRIEAKAEAKAQEAAVVVAEKAVCPRDLTCPLAQFDDLETTKWYHDGIHYCLENGLINGFPGNVFKPNGNITRAQLLTIMWRLADKPVVNYALTAQDVLNDEFNSWYLEAVRWAKAEGISSGVSEDFFGPNQDLTREEFASILYNYAKYTGVDTANVIANVDANKYEDFGLVSERDAAGMYYCIGAGVIGGDDKGKINPKSTATRAEAAAMLQRFCEGIDK